MCGADEVFLLETSTAKRGTVKKLWTWRAKEHRELPEALRGSFDTTDDCKPAEDGSKVLISSSGGGCALVERPSGRVLWYARVPNAHSLELLPRGRVVAASSEDAGGNRLILFDLTHSDQPINETPLPSAHGVVWDEKGQRLWALGFAELRCYQLNGWEGEKPSLALATSYPLPDKGGHDLQPVPPSADLVLTTGRHVYLFDRNEGKLRLHPKLGSRAGVKCVSVHPVSGQTACIQAGDEGWWSNALGFISPADQIKLPGERLSPTGGDGLNTGDCRRTERPWLTGKPTTAARPAMVHAVLNLLVITLALAVGQRQSGGGRLSSWLSSVPPLQQHIDRCHQSDADQRHHQD